MDELRPRALSEGGQQLLLAAHPLQPVARVDGHDHRAGQPVPRAVGGGRPAPDERGEAVLGRCGHELGDEPPRVGLHPALLAGDEEDEVQADVHAGIAAVRRDRP